MDSLRMIGNVDVPPRPPRCLLLTERTSAPVFLTQALFFCSALTPALAQTEGQR